MLVSIIILNWNGGQGNCLQAVASALAQDWEKKEVIFVDNGSTDGSGEYTFEQYPEIRYIKLPENIGCPAGRNVGAENASGELLFFLENDGVWASEDVVTGIVEKFL